LAGFVTITGMTGLYVVCSDNIRGQLVKQIDINMDDGDPSTGSLRAVVAGTSGVAGVTTANIVDGNAYTMCMTF